MIPDEVISILADANIIFAINQKKLAETMLAKPDSTPEEAYTASVVSDKASLLNCNMFGLSIGGVPKAYKQKRGIIGITIKESVLEISSYGEPFQKFITFFSVPFEYIKNIFVNGGYLGVETIYGKIAFEIPSIRAYEP